MIMPEMSGRELEKRLLAFQPHLRTLYVSGFAAEVIADRGMLAGGVLFLKKPLTPQELASSVRAILDRV